MDQSKRMKELIEILNRASKAYYQDNTEIMSNFEYDALYDELVELEKETGIAEERPQVASVFINRLRNNITFINFAISIIQIWQ